MKKSTHTPEYSALRERLSALRRSADLSQRAIAERLGVPHSWVAKVEAGERRIDLIEFGWFCAACSVSPAQEAASLLATISLPTLKRRVRARGRK